MFKSLRAAFDKVRDFVMGEVPPYSVTLNEYDTISDMMKERGCDLKLAYVPVWHAAYMADLGIVADEKTNVYKIMHAEAHLSEVYEIVTGRKMDRDNVIHYRPDQKPQDFQYPVMF